MGTDTRFAERRIRAQQVRARRSCARRPGRILSMQRCGALGEPLAAVTGKPDDVALAPLCLRDSSQATVFGPAGSILPSDVRSSRKRRCAFGT